MVVNDAPAAIKLGKDAIGNALEIKLENGGKTVKLEKYILPPLAQK